MGLHPWKLREAARHFRQGGLLAYPTEAVFGLGCDPLDPYAVRRILRLKQRPVEKGLILIAADFDQLRPFVQTLDDGTMQQVFESWPGPHTWLLPAADGLPYWLKGEHKTLAVRVTAHPVAAALCRACGSPLVSTSANLAGHPPARTALDVQRSLGGGIDMLIHSPVGRQTQPSTITDAVTGRTIRS
ncbi:MAG: L-threonylcarbamoyladenylate synthase [Candidatus Sedimenticola sp. 6PFRAG7]